MQLISNKPAKTKQFAVQILNKLKNQNTLALYGELGAGKTTFVQGLGLALKIKKRILSPTFILMRQYKINHPKFKYFFHVDLYRIKSSADLKSIDLDEIIKNPKNLVAIEWAKKAQSILPTNRLDIKFKIIDKNNRQIICNYL